MAIPRFDVPLPDRMKGLPKDHRGYVVPRFVEWTRDGKAADATSEGAEPDFRLFSPHHWVKCVRQNCCWICGNPLGTYKTWVIGPMCLINNITSEPPSHLPCAQYALKVCPFILNPNMKRIDVEDLGEVSLSGGEMDPSNPGVMVLVGTKAKTESFPDGKGGVLLKVPTPAWVSWWTRGRLATYNEADLALTLGYGRLEKIAREKDGPDAIPLLHKLYMAARKHLPK